MFERQTYSPDMRGGGGSEGADICVVTRSCQSDTKPENNMCYSQNRRTDLCMEHLPDGVLRITILGIISLIVKISIILK